MCVHNLVSFFCELSKLNLHARIGLRRMRRHGKRGNPPTIGVSLMRKLAQKFVVSLTPEHYTSRTCCRCTAPCGPWVELEAAMGKKVRGVRICQDERCKLPQNRDRTGASNIGLQFRRLFACQEVQQTCLLVAALTRRLKAGQQHTRSDEFCVERRSAVLWIRGRNS